MRKPYDPRPHWRAAVLASAALTPTTKLVLIVLHDHMNDTGKVDYGIRNVAADLGMRNFRRISDRITEAHRAGFLRTCIPAVHGRCAVYEARLPSDLETGSLGNPNTGSLGDRETGSLSDLAEGSLGNRVTTRLVTPDQGHPYNDNFSGTPFRDEGAEKRAVAR